MPAFKVFIERPYQVLLETDDWVEAQNRRLWNRQGPDEYSRMTGTHPTHDWDDQRPRRCRNCGGWDNGSYGSQSPCGYDWSHDSLVSAVEREMKARENR